MDARLTRAEAVYLLPLPATPDLERARALRLAAAEAYQAGLTEGARQLFARIGQVLFGWMERARVRAELNALSDHELADIGLTRGEIDRAIAEAQAEREARPAGFGMARAA